MDLKVVLVIVCLYALAITFTEGIPKCCIRTKKSVSTKTLMKVERFEMQTSSGACDIPALVLYIKNQKNPICAPPKMKTRVMVYWHRMKQSRQKSE
ncbi:C-C motif chemokine 27a [Acanthochromis polyacanthus]|uniref:Chemokine interleukin-8-like domain-containing protein n=1 Tax=Acanthochromis polyacanthus TaxID=80966 RepID=A0A3Q1FHN4_9TELE|nr:C-C motif chemokine 27a [Acanthochromis polyacanthus]